MSLLDYISGLFQKQKLSPKTDSFEEEDSFEWIFPPKNAHSADAWDKYWENQLKHGGIVPEIADMSIDDNFIVETAQRFGLKSVLCVGFGLSQEPVVLSKAGLIVTAMDISPFAVFVAKEMSKSFDSPEKYFDTSLIRDGGSIQFLEGDLFNANQCPGPYDIVIERRTIQDYPPEKHCVAVNCIISRLAKRGIVVCHCHDATWRPGKKPKHATRSELEKLGIQFWNCEELQNLDGQLAIAVSTTG